MASRSKKDPCKKYACELQTCLNVNNFQLSRCQPVMESLRQCCSKFKDISIVCDGIDIEPKKLGGDVT